MGICSQHKMGPSMKTHTIGDDPRLREILSELRSLIALAERAPWTPSQAQGIVEALRLGVPPAGAAVGLTVGREGLLARISRDLDYARHGKSRLVFLRGEYGMGKTHTLRVLQEYAHQHSFASSLVELSLRECPLHDLGLVYRKVVQNLQTSSHSAGSALESLLEEWADQIRKLGEQDRVAALTRLRRLHRDFRAALTTYFGCQQSGRSGPSQLVLEWMTGHRLCARERTAIGVSANVSETNALVMLGSLASMLQLTGIRGIAILLDEADATLSFEGATEGERAARNLNILMRASGTFPHSYFVYSTPPPFFRRRDLLSGITWEPQRVLDLEPLEPMHLIALAQKIRDLHLLAYVWENPSRVRDSEIRGLVNRLLDDHALRSSVRGFVRATVEVLDCCQLNAGLTLKAVMSRFNISTPLAS